jgi:hypothetical protein
MHARGIAKVRMHMALCYSCIYAVAITAHKIGRPDPANRIATFTYYASKNASLKETSQKRINEHLCARKDFYKYKYVINMLQFCGDESLIKCEKKKLLLLSILPIIALPAFFSFS